MKYLLLLPVLFALTACGADTAATAAAVAEGKAQEAKAAKNTEQRFMQKLDEANQKAAERAAAADGGN